MVLQKATGYSQVYRTWNLLRRAYSLYDGIYRLQTKDIATLYEIWCFIEVSHIVKELLGDDVDMDHHNRGEMNGLFTWNLKRENIRASCLRKTGWSLLNLSIIPSILIKKMTLSAWRILSFQLLLKSRILSCSLQRMTFRKYEDDLSL